MILGPIRAGRVQAGGGGGVPIDVSIIIFKRNCQDKVNNEVKYVRATNSLV